jgi:hypothetical protein
MQLQPTKHSELGEIIVTNDGTNAYKVMYAESALLIQAGTAEWRGFRFVFTANKTPMKVVVFGLNPHSRETCRNGVWNLGLLQVFISPDFIPVTVEAPSQVGF